MLEIPAGRFDIASAGLCFVVQEPLHVPEQSCIFLRGENGAGKTTFVEHVLIPLLRPGRQVVYVAQDLDVQSNTMRATLALLDHDAPATLPELVRAWVAAAPGADALILDEFDKYIPEGLASEEILRFSWVLCVSHVPVPAVYRRFQHGLAMHCARAGSESEVRITAEQLWPC